MAGAVTQGHYKSRGHRIRVQGHDGGGGVEHRRHVQGFKQHAGGRFAVVSRHQGRFNPHDRVFFWCQFQLTDAALEHRVVEQQLHVRLLNERGSQDRETTGFDGRNARENANSGATELERRIDVSIRVGKHHWSACMELASLCVSVERVPRLAAQRTQFLIRPFTIGHE